MTFNVTKSVVVNLEERNGHYQIVQGWINRNSGEFNPEFCKRKNWDDPLKEMTVVRPLSIYLGKDPGKIREFARYLLNTVDSLSSGRFEGTGGPPPSSGGGEYPSGDDDIPF